MSLQAPKSTCPKGSTVLVTGCHGFIATHIIDILLRSGYVVKGTVRTPEKATYVESVFHSRHPKSTFTTAIVPDLITSGSIDEALEGCTGLVHVAHDLSMVPDFSVGFTAPVQVMRNMLESAAKIPTLKRFVYTSSVNASGEPKAGRKACLTPDTWNHRSLEQVQNAHPPYSENYAMQLYYAAKVACEEAALEFLRQRQPTFVYNAVLPNFNVGPILTSKRPQGSAAFILGVYYGAPEAVGPLQNEIFLPPQQMVDVRDTAWLHVLALIEEDVKSERLISAAAPFSFNVIVEGMKSFAPEGHKVVGKKEGLALSGQTTEDRRSLELLERIGRVGWASTIDALRENCLGENK